MINEIFDIKGYSKDIYVNGKYVGSINMDQPDRETYGYFGRRTETISDDIIVNKKKIKKGQQIVTELQKICGRVR
jgi:hypothetical protein